VRWASRGLRVLEGVEGEEAQRWRARLLSDLAGFRQRQGRTREAERLCRQAIAEAEAAGELRALARACYVLDYALVESGRPEQATYSPRALDIYRELGDPEQESAVLNNLGMFAYWRGSWDEAIEYYRRQAACSDRSGNPANVAYTDCNVGEILSDQGRLAEATEHLMRARRVWNSTGDAPGVAFANLQLGRIAVRSGRYDEGLSQLTEAAAELRRFRLDGYADFARALVAEAEALGRNASKALELVEVLLESADRDVPLLRRVRGIALARLGSHRAALRELELSLQAATERRAHYDIAATLDAISRLGGLDLQRSAERDAILAQLDITALPEPLLGSDSPNPHHAGVVA
jgi:tetratricopeptide (TPR) repeat protein